MHTPCSSILALCCLWSPQTFRSCSHWATACWCTPICLTLFFLTLPSPDALLPADIPQLQPLGDRVLVRVQESADVTMGGVILPDSAKERPLRWGHDVPLCLWFGMCMAVILPDTAKVSGHSGGCVAFGRSLQPCLFRMCRASPARSSRGAAVASLSEKAAFQPCTNQLDPPAAAAPWCGWAPARWVMMGSARRPRCAVYIL